MKKIITLLCVACFAVAVMAEIPKGSRIYLDVTQHWCCHQAYYIYFSGTRTNQPSGGYRMTPDPANAGVYYFDTKAQSQDNIRFGYSDIQTDDYITNQPTFHTEDVNGYSTAKPYAVIDDDKGKTHHWAAAPSTTGTSEFDKDPQAIITYNCADSIYEARIYVTFNGAPCGLRVSSTLLPKAVQKGTPTSPFVVTLDTIRGHEGDQFTVTYELFSDRKCTSPISGQQRTVTYTLPEEKCTETAVLDTCFGEALTLSSSLPDATLYQWKLNGEVQNDLKTQTISVTAPSDENTILNYEVFAYRTSITAARNLMANGGFETDAGLLSDYTFVGQDETEYYTAHPGADNLYALTQDASVFWHDFVDVKPHSGNYFGLFDAGKSGFAWKATSNDNPALVVLKDTTYYFSYWAATPNMNATSPARLQFVISLDGGTTFTNLGNVYTLPADDNDWHQQVVTYVAPQTSVDVVIGVKDMNSDHDGNDFCLDDIMFQTLKYEVERIAFTNTYVVSARDCTVPPCTIPVYRKWDDFLHVDNSQSEYVAYEWYRNGVSVPGVNLPYLDLQNDKPQATDEFYVLLTKTDGSKVESCHTTFAQAKIWVEAQRQAVSRRRVVLSPQFSILITTYDDGSVTTEKQIQP